MASPDFRLVALFEPMRLLAPLERSSCLLDCRFRQLAQDLKPSNVLVFYVNTVLTVSKVADRGRASRVGAYSPYDEDRWAGDPNYAPPEILYSYIDPDWGKRRLAGDLYMLGSLVAFIFTQTTSLATLFHALPIQFWPANWGGTYEEVLPYVQNACRDLNSTVQRSASGKITRRSCSGLRATLQSGSAKKRNTWCFDEQECA